MHVFTYILLQRKKEKKTKFESSLAVSSFKIDKKYLHAHLNGKHGMKIY